MKKIVSLLLVSALVLGLGATAFAAEEPDMFSEPAAEEASAPEIPDVAADEPEAAPPAEEENARGGGYR